MKPSPKKPPRPSPFFGPLNVGGAGAPPPVSNPVQSPAPPDNPLSGLQPRLLPIDPRTGKTVEPGVPFSDISTPGDTPLVTQPVLSPDTPIFTDPVEQPSVPGLQPRLPPAPPATPPAFSNSKHGIPFGAERDIGVFGKRRRAKHQGLLARLLQRGQR